MTAATMRRRVGLLTLGMSAVKSAQIVLALVLVHLLADEAWNAVALALSIYLAALTVGSFNLQQSLVFFLPLAAADRQRAVVARTVRLLSGVGLAIGAVLAGVAVLTGGVGTLSASGCALLGVALAAELPTVCAPAVFVSQGRFGRGAAWDVGTSAAQVAAMVVPAAAGGGAEAVLAGLLVSSVARRVAFVAVVGSLPRGAPAPPGVLRRQLAYCVPLGITLAAGVLTRSVDKWIVAAVDPRRLGVYAVAAQELPVLAVLPYAGGAAVAVELVRRFAAGSVGEAMEAWTGQAAAMSALVLPSTVFLVVAAPELWALLFPASYGGGVFAFRCFTLIGVHRVTEYGLLLRAADRGRALVRLGVLLLAANAALALAGGLVWGGDGVAVGCLAAYLVVWICTVAAIGRIFAVPFHRAFPWARWARWLAISAAAALAALALASFAGRAAAAGAPVRLLVKAAVFAAVLAVAVRARSHRSAPSAEVAGPPSQPTETSRREAAIP